MRPQSSGGFRVLVIDIGGSHVKFIATGRKRAARFESGPKLTPKQMVRHVRRLTKGWRFDAVSIGYPGVVRNGVIAREPHNLGTGWVGFDFQSAFGVPTKTVNDAAMQALGGYAGGRMLFLGLGTGLGSALIVDGAIVAMELGHLHCGEKQTYEDLLGRDGRKRLGKKKWRAKVRKVVEGFRNALLPDDIALGGGNAAHVKRLPRATRLIDNACAFEGGFRLWEDRRDDHRS
jgi:polyphosphate glucokinase